MRYIQNTASMPYTYQENVMERLKKMIDSTINTKEEWEDMFQLLMDHSEEVTGLNDSQIKSLLQQSIKEL